MHSSARADFIRITIPGKTFLVGEYLALVGGPSLVATTAPRFEAAFTRSAPGEGSLSKPFHAESPAGRLWSTLEREIELSPWHVTFVDPHRGLGGLGASTAQFASVVAFAQSLGAFRSPPADWDSWLRLYRDCAWSGDGLAPSGADLVAQVSGGVVAYDGRTSTARVFAWPFPDLAFTLLRTGRKLATHEHLRKARAEALPETEMREISSRAIEAFSACESAAFADSLFAYGDLLAKFGLRAESTGEILRDLRATLGSAVAAAKGCGAMGADVIVVAHAPDCAGSLRRWADGAGLALAGGSEDVGPGLELAADGERK